MKPVQLKESSVSDAIDTPKTEFTHHSEDELHKTSYSTNLSGLFMRMHTNVFECESV